MAGVSDSWTVGDFLKHFEAEIDRAVEERFKVMFRQLTAEMSLLDAEFMTQKTGCGGDLDNILTLLHSISGRLGYCERPRGFERDCDRLFADVEAAVDRVKKFRQSCST